MELGPVERITTDAMGEPGARTFFLQARSGGHLVTVVVEKQQVQLLAASILELLADIELETGQGPPDEEMELEEPVEPLFRAGRLSIGYEPDRDMFLLDVEELVPEPEEGGPEALLLPDPQILRLWARREQMLALSRYGTAVSERGRPTCQLCGNPIDPRGHTCPATNGHRRRTG
ncbi:MAG: DUF3090 family protein [Actinobacteria bacterium]|nr:DUF3090 family protein [Actinomycetota bacterium]